MGAPSRYHGKQDGSEWLAFSSFLPSAGECVLLTDGVHITIGKLDENGVPTLLLHAEDYEMGTPVRWMPLPSLDFQTETPAIEKRRTSWLRWSAQDPFGPPPKRSFPTIP